MKNNTVKDNSSNAISNLSEKCLYFDKEIESKMRIIANYLIDRFIEDNKKGGLKIIKNSNTLIMEPIT